MTMVVNAGLIIDFGNSETRINVISGKFLFKLIVSNKFYELEPNYRIPDKYNNGKSTILQYQDSYYANGEIVEREFAGVELKPTAIQDKYDQKVTRLTLQLAFSKAIGLLAQRYNIPPSELDVTFNVSVLLPPMEHDKNKEKFEEMIKTFTSVRTVLPMQMDKNFAVSEATAYSEAVSAFFGAFYEEIGVTPNPENVEKDMSKGDVLIDINSQDSTLVDVKENVEFQEGYVLVLDIGAGTTDLALFDSMELVERSKETLRLGGNTVESGVRREIKMKHGYLPTTVDSTIKTGILKEGSKLHDVAELVTNEKQKYSKSMRKEIINYLEFLTIPMQMVKGLLVVGGGALPSVRDGEVVSPAMSQLLIQYLQELAPEMKIVSVGDKNLRTLNIEGLRYLHKYN